MEDYTLVTIDLLKKPEWYSLKVNLAGKVSHTLLRFPRARHLDSRAVDTQIPAITLPPGDPVLRPKARILVVITDSKVVDAFRGFFFTGVPADDSLFANFVAFQALLPPTSGFAVGEWSIADVAVGPYLVRMLMLLEHEIGKYPVGEGRKVLETLRGPRFVRVMKYVEDVKAWPSFRATWDEAATLAMWKVNPAIQRT
ncbi:hypothetical protein GSI_09677 [Ganoderma sinense ZZ0214-1]|uniref:GST N-terminal domain-containing protein n=1 Tax=Ganoderma sinense ZZ0214-1 TaxID=1077348 RepID=A0A2G8S3B7_9APHY|nr:hypothetical protein GSI_09677 [Ganoderma sinense ZZ0214-1]